MLSVPAGANLDLIATNGGLQLNDVEGRFTLRTENGPIGINRASGVVSAETENGPNQFRGHAGDVRLTAQNGPVEVNLDARALPERHLHVRTALDAPIAVVVGGEAEGIDPRR